MRVCCERPQRSRVVLAAWEFDHSALSGAFLLLRKYAWYAQHSSCLMPEGFTAAQSHISLVAVGGADEGDVAMGPVRTLQATGTFSSFVLWNLDIPMDESRDEYLRSLTEWTKDCS